MQTFLAADKKVLTILASIYAVFLKKLVQALAGHSGFARRLRHISGILLKQGNKIDALGVI
jgi:hypothetical protein